MASEKIVVIEDEPDILEVLQFNLEREGFEVKTASSGTEGLQVVEREEPDLVLLDLLLPGVDGLDVCRRLRSSSRQSNVPIIMVTAKGEESDVVLGLGLGADDYVQKPFSPKELVARVKALLRRSQQPTLDEAPKRIVRGPVVIEPERHRILVDGEKRDFTPTEFRLLHFLASHPGRVFSRDQLVNRAIGDQAVVIDRNIDVHIRSVRKKIEPHRDLIETVRGIGYAFRELSSGDGATHPAEADPF
ncbi:MAG: DNA-binding response regulator [Acidobacteria bacterium]|nr:MAG: DNA-binding response regulator [Acidobacteriota bacterium]REJ99522.1 MAG: DNA-binding response regulator [Acidobacteriota bacterium]